MLISIIYSTLMEDPVSLCRVLSVASPCVYSREQAQSERCRSEFYVDVAIVITHFDGWWHYLIHRLLTGLCGFCNEHRCTFQVQVDFEC